MTHATAISAADASPTIPAPPLWGPRTRCALSTYAISRERMAPEFIEALGWVKFACARANVETGALCRVRGEAIQAAARELVAGMHAAQFPLAVWQSALGTQTHDNVNEVVAARASALLDAASGLALPIDPDADVSLNHDAEDAMPTALHVAAVQMLHHRLLPALARLRGTLAVKSHHHRGQSTDDTARAGRALGAFETRLAQAQRLIESARGPLLELALGARADDAVRTEFSSRACALLAEGTGHPFRPAGDRFAAVGSTDSLVALHATFKVLAISLLQVVRDVDAMRREGPPSAPDGAREGATHDDDRAGAGVGEVEASIGEALTMACAQVIGHDGALATVAASGAMRGRSARPLVAHVLLQSLVLLADSMVAFDARVMRGLDLSRPPAEGRAPAGERIERAGSDGRDAHAAVGMGGMGGTSEPATPPGGASSAAAAPPAFGVHRAVARVAPRSSGALPA